MSNDLISRNEVMKLIESKFVDGCLEEGDKTLIDGYGLLDDVSDMPTAYDVDKIVKRLEEAKYEDELYPCNLAVEIEEAKRIVKYGGIR